MHICRVAKIDGRAEQRNQRTRKSSLLPLPPRIAPFTYRAQRYLEERGKREREREKRQRRGQLDRRCILNNFIGTTGCYREVDTVREEEKEDKKNPCDNKIYIIFIRACAFSISSNKKLALERGANS